MASPLAVVYLAVAFLVLGVNPLLAWGAMDQELSGCRRPTQDHLQVYRRRCQAMALGGCPRWDANAEGVPVARPWHNRRDAKELESRP